MTLATKELSTYGAAFRASSEGARGSVPSWVAQLRESAFERFEEQGFPTTDREDWKYTNVAPVERAGFRPAAGPAPGTFDADAVEPFVYEEARASRLVFVNGFLQEHLSSVEALPPSTPDSLSRTNSACSPASARPRSAATTPAGKSSVEERCSCRKPLTKTSRLARASS